MQMKRKGENHTKSSFLGIALANVYSASRDTEIMARRSGRSPQKWHRLDIQFQTLSLPPATHWACPSV